MKRSKWRINLATCGRVPKATTALATALFIAEPGLETMRDLKVNVKNDHRSIFSI